MASTALRCRVSSLRSTWSTSHSHLLSPSNKAPFTSSGRPRAQAASAPLPTAISWPTRTVTPTRPYSSQPPNHGSTSPVKFWPFALIAVTGFGAYAWMVNKRAAAVTDMPAIEAAKNSGAIGAPAKPTPTFSPKDVTVIFVLGGPGAGKGTQCANLVRDHGFTHLSAGDLLRAEQERDGSEYGQLIRDHIRDGQIVPMEVTVALLENAMTASLDPSGGGRVAGRKGRFLIDGFPRKMDQAVRFEQAVCPARFVLFYDCPENELERRLLNRGKTSGRSDDNAESIRKRFRTFLETSLPVVDYFEKEGRVIKVDATPDPETVHKHTRDLLERHLGKDF